jgi:carbohydrate-binding DOMON domain-containing protein
MIGATEDQTTDVAVPAWCKGRSHKGLRHKTTATSGEGEDIWQDLQEDSRTGGWKVNGQIFDWAVESEWLRIVEESAPSETKEMSKAQPSEKKKWWYAYRLFETNSL